MRGWHRIACLVFGAAVCIGHQRAEAVILINEILADPPAIIGDANGDGIVSSTQDEFIELVNTSALPVSLEGWTLADLVGIRQTFAGGSTIPALGFFVVFGSTASSGTLSLNNGGDTLTLRDQASQLIDTFVYGSEGGMDVSLTRAPDALGPWVKHSSVSPAVFSPGRTVDGNPSLPAPTPPMVPEPSAALLMTLGFLSMVSFRRRVE